MRGLRLSGPSKAIGGSDGKHKSPIDDMGRPEQIAHVEGLVNALYTDAEITAHVPPVPLVHTDVDLIARPPER
jgi:hypothetical protein